MLAMSSSTAIFASSDLERTLAYYVDVLGFELAWTWGDPPSLASVRMGGISIMISHDSDVASKIRGHQHWLDIDEIDKLYDFHRAKDARIISEIEDKPWGFREYVVEDPDGYHLRFAGAQSSKTQGSSQLPAGVTFERRKPTSEEYTALVGEVVGYRDSLPKVLERTWDGIVACSPQGDTIGVLRIMWDAPGWFSIWDVAVLPSWQGQNIGSEIMKRALEAIRERSPGALVFLFTTKHGFYERLKFTQENVSMLRL